MGVLNALSRMYVDPSEKLMRDTQYFTQSLGGLTDRIAYKKAGKEILDYVKSESDEVDPNRLMEICQKYNIKDPERLFSMLKSSRAMEAAAQQRKMNKMRMGEAEERKAFMETEIPSEQRDILARKRGLLSQFTMPGISEKERPGAFGLGLTPPNIPEQTVTQNLMPEGATYGYLDRLKGVFPEEKITSHPPGSALYSGREQVGQVPPVVKPNPFEAFKRKELFKKTLIEPKVPTLKPMLNEEGKWTYHQWGDGDWVDTGRGAKIPEKPEIEYKPGQALEKIATAQRAKAIFDRTKQIDIAMTQLFPEFKSLIGKRLSPEQVATVNESYDRLIDYLEGFTPKSELSRDQAIKQLQTAGQPITEANITYVMDQL